MPCAMKKIGTVPRLRYAAPRLIVDLSAVKNLSRSVSFLHGLDRGVATITDYAENLLMFRWDGFTDEKSPGDVVIDGVRQLLLGPHIDEQEVSFFHRKIVCGIRCIVWICTVGIDGDDRRMSGG